MPNDPPKMGDPQEREAALFALALEQPPASRMAFLDLACAGNPDLRHRLEVLLAAHDAPESVLTEPLNSVQATVKMSAPEALMDEAVGQIIGRYKLLEKLGEGGCGVVYVAEQTEPVRRRVALKVIKSGMDTRAVIARFEAEQQAVAMMDHPHIARVLDAGSTPTGRPYFVMELVRGIRITDYCDQEKVSTRERIELFIKTCQAIQHAHQKGIIHRDIKPSNILVTLHDGVPVPKVIDFGIAKATEGRLTEATVYTQLHQFIGTPAYMSPEQAEMSGLDIDTRSDIYSLGVLLYELLTGKTPFDPKELMSKGIDAMRRTIREREPARPSTRLATLNGDELTTTARCRSSDLPRLLHLMRGDLDWIVMKCLEKDRSRRYETANGLAADLKRFLASEPVVARPPSTAYKFSKFVRRNKLVVGGSTALALALIVGLGSATVMFLRERALVRDLRAERLSGALERATFAAMSGDSHALELALKEAEAKDVSGGQIVMFRGLHAMTCGQPEEAVKHLRAAASSLPQDVATHALLATALLYAQDYAAHLEVMSKLDTLKERTPEDYLFKGQALGFGDPDLALRLLDHAVQMKPSALAHILRAQARSSKAARTDSRGDMEEALADVALAKAKSWSQQNVTLLVESCFAHIEAAEIYRRAGDGVLASNHLALADVDGRQLEQFSTNPHAARFRIWQLEIAGREDGPEGSFQFTQRLLAEQNVRYPQIQLSYGNALLRRGKLREALEAYDSVRRDGWIDSMRLFALFELPDRRKEFENELAKILDRYPREFGESGKPVFLLYAGQKKRARELALNIAKDSAVYARLPEPDQRIMSYLAGTLPENDLLAAVHGELYRACFAHCVIGFQHLADQDLPGAKEHFRQAIDTTAFLGPPYCWAQVALAQANRHQTWPPVSP